MKNEEQQDSSLTPMERISRSVIILRGERVILDHELAAIYGVTTKRLNQKVRRNIARFPADFMFRLTESETKSLRPQGATLDVERGRYAKHQPYAFTECGAIQAANVLKSPQAVAMGICLGRGFVEFRQLACSRDDTRHALAKLENRLLEMDEMNREHFTMIYEALDALSNSPASARRPMGFTADLNTSH